MNRILRATAALYVGHLLTYRRSRTAIYWTLAFPLFFLMIFGLVFGRGRPSDFNALMPGLLTITIISGSLFGVSLRMVTERESGVLRRYRLTPVHPLSVVLAHGATGLTTLLLSVLVQGAVALIVFKFRVAGSLPTLALVIVLGGLAMIPIGLVVGSVARDSKVAPAMTNFLFFPLMFLSGAAIPFPFLPDWLQRVARLLPTTYLVESLQGVIIRGLGVLSLGLPAVILLLTAAIGITVNGLLFRWEGTEPVRVKRLLLAIVALVVVYGAGYLIEPTLHIAERMPR
jgi:ABC-2 type transport system permease protein